MKTIIKLLGLLVVAIVMTACSDKDDPNRVLGIGPAFQWIPYHYDSSNISVDFGEKSNIVTVGADGGSMDIRCSYSVIWIAEPGLEDIHYISNDWMSIQITGRDIHCEFKPEAECLSNEKFSCLFTEGDVSSVITFVRKGHENDKPSPANLAPFEMKIRVNGEPYSGIVSFDENGEYVYEDPEFGALMAQIDENENMEMLIFGDEYVDYIDRTLPDVDALIKKVAAIPNQSESATRASNPGFEAMDSSKPGYFGVFDNDGFKGSSITKSLETIIHMYTMPNLKNQSMNDKITSIAVAYNHASTEVCSVLTIWEDTDFNNGDNSRKKHRVSVIATATNRQVSLSDLKKVKCPNSSSSWNDKISALCFHFGYVDSHLLDY